jgi:HEAT repeats
MEPAMIDRAHSFAVASLAVAALSIAQHAAASEGQLSKQIVKQDGWVSYEVPIVANAGAPCCYDMHGSVVTRIGCDLDGRGWTSSTTVNGAQPHIDASLAMYVHVHDAHVDKVRAFAASCPVRNADNVRRIDGVNGADSVTWLAEAVARDASFGEAADAELAAIAWHADASATTELQKFSDTSQPRKLREQALFWSGQMRGVSGAQLVEHVAVTDADPELRAHAVFVLTQSSGIDGYTSIHRIAQTDASDHVREQALFWMAQTGDARAKNDIVDAIHKESSDKVREQAVFALSQLKEGTADAALIEVVRGDYPRKVKEQALFWLGQSGSDAALKFLDEVLVGSVRKSHAR